MDFGLAKREAGEISMTLDGQVRELPLHEPGASQGRGSRRDPAATSTVWESSSISFSGRAAVRARRGCSCIR